MELRLVGEQRGWLEHCFGQTLADVRLSVVPSAPERLVPPAWCAGERIVLTEPVASGAIGPAMQLAVIAHELAHVLQRRMANAGAGPGATSLALEAEAHRAAAAVLLGRHVVCVLLDHGPKPRAWGPAGHYWTAYFVMLAAGMDAQTALDMAFYAQMPDQVDELDATEAGINYVATGIGGSDFIDAGTVQQMQNDLVIQTGLHCLTGGPSEPETRRRAAILMKADLGSFEFGLAIHPFGDTFAHRTIDNPAMLYGRVLGHLVEVAHFRNPHTPDFLNARPALYRRYGEELYDIMASKTYVRLPAMSRGNLGQTLSSVAKLSGEEAQIRALQSAIGQVASLPIDGYDPNQEKCTGWSAFRAAHPEVPEPLLQTATNLARTWSAGAAGS